MEYSIVTQASIEALSKMVNRMLVDGWKPLGAPVYDPIWQKWNQAVTIEQVSDDKAGVELILKELGTSEIDATLERIYPPAKPKKRT
jgi:hypothetical protein